MSDDKASVRASIASFSPSDSALAAAAPQRVEEEKNYHGTISEQRG